MFYGMYVKKRCKTIKFLALSVWIDFNLYLVCVSSKKLNWVKTKEIWDFICNKDIQVNWEIASKKVTYLAPILEVIGDGSHISMNNNSRVVV